MAIPVNKYAATVDSRIVGNVSPERKQQLESIMYQVMSRPDVFASMVGRRVVITEASIVPKVEEASRTEARVVCELTVEKGSFCRVRGSEVAYPIHVRHGQPRRKFARWLRCVPDRHVAYFSF